MDVIEAGPQSVEGRGIEPSRFQRHLVPEPCLVFRVQTAIADAVDAHIPREMSKVLMRGLDRRLKKLQGNLKDPPELREAAAEKKLWSPSRRSQMEKEKKPARERASIIIRVRSGALTVTEGAERLEVSPKTYYEWEDRALQAMALASEDGSIWRCGSSFRMAILRIS